MGVVSYKLKYENSESSDFAIDGNSHELTYIIRVSSVNDVSAVVASQGPFLVGEPFHLNGSTDYTSICKSIAPKRISDTRWEVAYKFEKPEPGKDDRQDPTTTGQEVPPEPWLRIPRIVRGNQKKQITIEKAWRVIDGVQRPNKEAVLMSNGQAPASAITRNQEMLDFTIVRAERYWPKNICMEYTGRLNSDSFDGHEPGTVLCDAITGEWLTTKIGTRYYPYWDVTYRFIWKSDGWDDEVLQQGTLVKTAKPGGGYYYLAAVDPLGIPLGGPVLLDNEGAKLADGGTPVFWKWRWRPTKKFSALKIKIPK